jgi:hypothetical protein
LFGGDEALDIDELVNLKRASSLMVTKNSFKNAAMNQSLNLVEAIQ